MGGKRKGWAGDTLSLSSSGTLSSTPNLTTDNRDDDESRDDKEDEDDDGETHSLAWVKSLAG